VFWSIGKVEMGLTRFFVGLTFFGQQARVTMYTTLWGAEAAAEGITSGGELEVYSVQGLHGVLE
jgi:hypothetical protein